MKSLLIALLVPLVVIANPFEAKITENTAESHYIGNLLRHAQATSNWQRKLGNDDGSYGGNVDLSAYSIRFEKCQFLKQYDVENNDHDADTVLATKRVVVFRLCPKDSCSSCLYNYGEYIVDLDTYLKATLTYKQSMQEDYCDACYEVCNDDDDEFDDDRNRNQRGLKDLNCNSCAAECENIENIENNGYIDASLLTRCNMVYKGKNTGVSYYAAAMCSADGSRIRIGLFEDQYCSIFSYEGTINIDKYLKNENGYNVRPSYHLLKQTFPKNECVMDCDESYTNDDDANASPSCTDLYQSAAKCESSHGFKNGIYKHTDAYANQVSQENLVCNYITSVKNGAYDQEGDIAINAGLMSASGRASTSALQKTALTVFGIGMLGAGAYVAWLHRQIVKRSEPNLDAQGGIMA